jgi:hypothetical protein
MITCCAFNQILITWSTTYVGSSIGSLKAMAISCQLALTMLQLLITFYWPGKLSLTIGESCSNDMMD